MSNPFENPEDLYLVLINSEGQYSLWPDFLKIPDGWEKLFGAEERQACLDYISSRWDNLMPNSLKTAESTGSRK